MLLHSSTWGWYGLIGLFLCFFMSQSVLRVAADGVPRREGRRRVQVETVQGVVEGLGTSRAHIFLGIPFAAPPVGDLRWKPPRSPMQWDGVWNATFFRPACQQVLSPDVPVHAMSEDCLYLNVFVPTEPPPYDGFAVMLWLHPGFNMVGHSGQPTYDGQVLAEAGHVIVVSANYRVGPLGFLAHPALSDEDASHPTSGNYGLMDQRKAMEWVRDNIAAFGGNPKAVTVFGESAGAADICFHLVMPQSQGLFQRAVMQSGSCVQGYPEPWPLIEDYYAVGEDFAEELGCSRAADVMACMRDVPAENVTCALLDVDALPNTYPWAVTVDGWEIPGNPLEQFRRGRYDQGVAILMGSTWDEGTYVADGNMTWAEFEEFVMSAFGSKKSVPILSRYSLSHYSSVSEAYGRMWGHWVLNCAHRRLATLLASADNAAPVYLYMWTHVPSWTPNPFQYGAHHTSEVPFVFHRPFPVILGDGKWARFTEAEETLSQEVIGYWTRFAVSGNPNDKAAVRWPSYSPKNDDFLLLNVNPMAVRGVLSDVCDLWDRVNEDVELRPPVPENTLNEGNYIRLTHVALATMMAGCVLVGVILFYFLLIALHGDQLHRRDDFSSESVELVPGSFSDDEPLSRDQPPQGAVHL